MSCLDSWSGVGWLTHSHRNPPPPPAGVETAVSGVVGGVVVASGLPVTLPEAPPADYRRLEVIINVIVIIFSN